MDGSRWLRAGRVGRPHGLDGSFHVNEPSPLLLEVGAPVMIDDRVMRIVRRAGDDRRPILRLQGLEDRPGAESLRGRELLVERLTAPELAPDEWWPEQLEGCVVRDGDREVGTVRRLLPLPSCEVLEVARADGGEDLLVPLVSDAVRAVSAESREIDVDLGFLGED
ncbi:MAG: rRNA processing protein RimM [Actinomycetota bacterium]|nr:rRNA processing protein RimM [Actinomycetota bacterium]